jgi:RHS repeat-associated protein
VVAFPSRRVAAKNRCTPAFRSAVSRARYYQPTTGRFWTLDTYQGNSEDPLSLHKYLYCRANPINHIDPSGHDLGDLILTMEIQVSIAAQTIAPIVNAARIAVAGIFVAEMTFNDQFRQDALGLGPNLLSETIAESGMVLYDLSGMAINTIRLSGTTVPEVAKLGETILKNVSDDAFVHFVPINALKKVEVEGLKYVDGGVGLHFFRAGQIKNLTMQQAQSALGDLAGSSQNIGAAAIVDSSKLSNVEEFQKAFWTEYVTQQQGVMPDEIRYLSGGSN